jgi:hypothetical protein
MIQMKAMNMALNELKAAKDEHDEAARRFGCNNKGGVGCSNNKGGGGDSDGGSCSNFSEEDECD